MPLILLSLAAATASPPGLDGLFAGVDRVDTPGCALDVRQSGVPVAQRSYGLADLEDGRGIDADTVFEAGSVSKQFVGAAAAWLAVHGKLSLDDSVRRWLPELPARDAAITVRMLLNHTSGLRNWDNLAELTGWPEGTRVYDQGWALRAVARQSRLNFRPGTEYLYSNSNYVLAAIIVERASGQGLDAFSRAALFGPLGMRRTQWRDDFRRIVPGRAQAYMPDGTGGWRLEMPFGDVVGAGGLLTTVGDLQRWNAALSDPRPEDRAWVAMLTEPGRLEGGTRIAYGLGVELDPVAGRPAFSHAGATASYRAWLGRFPKDGVSVALLCNAGSLDTEDLGPRVAALFLPKADEAAAPAPRGMPAAGVAGLYRNRANDAAVDVTADGAAVRFNGGVPLVAAGPNRLVSADGRRSTTISRARDGTVRAISLGRIGNAPVALVPVRAWRPAVAALSGFAGRYRSVDIDGDQRIVMVGGNLVWRDPAGNAVPLKPLYTDAFDAAGTGWTLRFLRDARGRTIGFDASLTRARKIRFARAVL